VRKKVLGIGVKGIGVKGIGGIGIGGIGYIRGIGFFSGS
jgi:hypothetical protein